QLAKWGRFTFQFVDLNKPNKGFLYRLFNQLLLTFGLLLFKYIHRLIEVRIACLNIGNKVTQLQVLAAQTQYRNARHIRMVSISCQQLAQNRSILPDTTTSALVI